MMFANK